MTRPSGGPGADPASRVSPAGRLAAAWGVGGVLGVLGVGVAQLSVPAWTGLRQLATVGQGLFLLGTLALFAWLKGWHGFQRRFAPRVVSRARALARRPRWLEGLLAPLYCMALFGAPPRRLLWSWGLVAFIATAVAVLSRVPQPWRGLVDVGVVVGLGWGAVAIVSLSARALFHKNHEGL